MTTYARPYEVKASDLDANGHVHYSAYIDAAAELRYGFFAERGFSAEAIRQMGITPVYTLVVARFLREVRAGETLTITYLLEGLSASGARWKIHHDILKTNGKKACLLNIEGAVLDLRSRTIVAPPLSFLTVFQEIPRSPAFAAIPERFSQA